ncbi:MAG: hypothetical protein V3W44_08610 [Dehalococcoidales bacterium]
MANCVKVVFYDKDQPHDSNNLDLIVREAVWANLSSLRNVRLPILAIKLPVPPAPSPGTLTFTGFSAYSIGFSKGGLFEPRDSLVVYDIGIAPHIVNRHIIFDDGQQLLGESLDGQYYLAYLAAGDLLLISLSFTDSEYSGAQLRANALDVGDCT